LDDEENVSDPVKWFDCKAERIDYEREEDEILEYSYNLR
jgi:hypothetical protein